MWHIYILKSAGGNFYTGVTTDIARRLREHNGEKKGGARATRAHRPYTLVYTETCASRSEAQVREYAIKKLGKAGKVLLVKAYVTK